MLYYIYQLKYLGKYNEVHTSKCRNEADYMQKIGFSPLVDADNDLEAMDFARLWHQSPEPTACPKCMNIEESH